jgi:arginine/ornithine N-succinyltransferase beta subunit
MVSASKSDEVLICDLFLQEDIRQHRKSKKTRYLFIVYGLITVILLSIKGK